MLSQYRRAKNGSLERIVQDTLAAAAVGPAPLDESLKKLFMTETTLAPVAAFAKEVPRASRDRRAQLVDILAVSDRKEGDTSALLRDAALDGVITTELLRALSNSDPEWLAAHVEALLSRNPDHAGAILAWGGRAMHAVKYDEVSLQEIVALARTTGLDAKTFVARIREAFGIWALEAARKDPIIDAIETKL